MAVGKNYTIGTTTVELEFYGFAEMDFDRKVVYQISTNGGSTWTTKATRTLSANDPDPSCSYTYTGLTPGTTYWFRAELRRSSDNYFYNYYPSSSPNYYEWTTEGEAYTHTLKLTGTATAGSVTVTVELTSGLTNYDVDLTVYLDGARNLECDISAGSLSRSRTWVTDIEPGTVYRITLVDKMRDKEWYTDVLTNYEFDWSTNVSSGADFNLLASDWNDFTSKLKVKESFYTSKNRTFTTAVKGNDFTAAMFNQAVNAINNLVSNKADGCVTTMSTVSKDDNVTAAMINKLAACLNE